MTASGYSARTLGQAKVLRAEATDAEQMLWRLLRAKRLSAFKFRRQQPIGPYIADFACQVERLVIEADGSQHLDSPHDQRRTAWLGEHGYRVLRFWNNDILLRKQSVLDTIYAALTIAPAPFPSPLEGEGDSALAERGEG